MFDPQYLATMTVDELETLADGCQQSMEREQRKGEYALAGWWWRLHGEVREALYSRHVDMAGDAFARQQLVIPGCPGRVAPDDRNAA